MWAWVKKLFNGSEAFVVVEVINALNLLDAPLAREIEQAKGKIAAMSSQDLADWVILTLQTKLRAYFRIA